ncbi:MAG: putative methylase [Candidatus Nanohaloarchaea archaeon]
MRKSHLARKLSKVEDFENPKVKLEQYITPASLAADLLHTAYMQGDIEGKKVVDLGAGTGILSIGASLLNGKVTSIEKDEEAIKSLKKNRETFGVEFSILNKDVESIELDSDTVVMNPPFSVHSELGMKFWQKAVETGSKVYAVSPHGKRSVIKDFVEKSGFRVVATEGYTVSLPPTFGFHTEASQEIEVDIIIAEQED